MVATWILAGLLAAVAPGTLASCAYGTHLHRRTGEITRPNFSYYGATGPAAWHVIDDGYHACANGTNQSPISVAASSTKLMTSTDFHFNLTQWPAGATYEHLGTTIEVVASCGKLSLGGVDYSLVQFHFHLPSEHLDDGNSYAMEVHFVWQSADSQLAVTGLFIDVDYYGAVHPLENATDHEKREHQIPGSGPIENASSVIESVLALADQIPTLGSHINLPHALDMSLIADKFMDGSFHHYDGSLTTPPCSEGVKWYISDQMIHITSDSFIKARKALGYNARFPQGTPGETNVLSL